VCLHDGARERVTVVMLLGARAHGRYVFNLCRALAWRRTTTFLFAVRFRSGARPEHLASRAEKTVIWG
jgi:hypothetical protein